MFAKVEKRLTRVREESIFYIDISLSRSPISGFSAEIVVLDQDKNLVSRDLICGTGKDISEKIGRMRTSEGLSRENILQISNWVKTETLISNLVLRSILNTKNIQDLAQKRMSPFNDGPFYKGVVSKSDLVEQLKSAMWQQVPAPSHLPENCRLLISSIEGSSDVCHPNKIIKNEEKAVILEPCETQNYLQGVLYLKDQKGFPTTKKTSIIVSRTETVVDFLPGIPTELPKIPNTFKKGTALSVAEYCKLCTKPLVRLRLVNNG